MADIKTYADGLLLDFADAGHLEMKRVLEMEFGSAWMAQGVQKHFKADQFSRVERMLQNPMRVVDMNKSPDEIYGLEHFWNIINGNWNLFGNSFGDKQRTEVYLGEITELRNNLAHRMRHHVLLKSDLIRIVGSCRMVLSALGSSQAEKFAETVDSLSSGGSPWGAALAGYLPPSDEMYAEFVGRPGELKDLSDWLASDTPQILVWGYGGAGKSALAYKFARDVREGSSEDLIAVCWVSAKKTEYVEGAVRDRPADFSDMDSLIRAIWSALYTTDDFPDTLEPSSLIDELKGMPILLIVDDFDTIAEDQQLAEFLIHDLRRTRARVVYTSRQRVTAIRNVDVPPFSDKQLLEFVSVRSVEYGANQKQCVARLNGIKSVTGGYPLFVDDLIHHAAFVGVDKAMEDWSQRKGDAAREYALRRQVEYLGHNCTEVLITLSVAERALIPVEISSIAGLTDRDAEAGLEELLRWKMVHRVMEDDSSSPGYRMNANTSRLVQQTFRDDNRQKTFSVAFKSLTGERAPESKRRAIGKIIYGTKELERNVSFEAARQHLIENMTGELKDAPDLHSVLGWLCSKQPIEEYSKPAREAFSESHRLGSSKVDTYFYWTMLEKQIAEWMINNAEEGEVSDSAIAEQWRECGRIAELGIQRCGSSQLLCYWAGYAASREARARNRVQNFAHAQGASARSADLFKQALDAPVSDVATVNKGAIYRGLTLAFEGLGDEQQLRRSLSDWYAFSGREPYIETEYRRLILRYPILRTVPDLQALLAQIQF